MSESLDSGATMGRAELSAELFGLGVGDDHQDLAMAAILAAMDFLLTGF